VDQESFNSIEYGFRKVIQKDPDIDLHHWWEYYKNIEPFDGVFYFVILFVFSLMLILPFLNWEYELRVCYNRLKVQERNNRIMQKQSRFSELLLGRLLPPDIVSKLRETKKNNIELAEDYRNVTILFCDMVGFTKFSSELDPGELMSFLSELYARYVGRASEAVRTPAGATTRIFELHTFDWHASRRVA